MNENYTSQILGSDLGSDPTQFDAIADAVRWMEKGKNGKGKKKRKKANKKLRKQIKALEQQQQFTQQLLALALWQGQTQGSIFDVESPKKKKKKKNKKQDKTPAWLEQVLVQSLPTIITTGFDRMLLPSQIPPVLDLPDGRSHKQ